MQRGGIHGTFIGKHCCKEYNSCSERTHEQAEVDEAMQILRDDGVLVPSDMFFEALELFKNSVSRREFKNLVNTEERIAWLTWHLNMNNK